MIAAATVGRASEEPRCVWCYGPIRPGQEIEQLTRHGKPAAVSHADCSRAERAKRVRCVADADGICQICKEPSDQLHARSWRYRDLAAGCPGCWEAYDRDRQRERAEREAEQLNEDLQKLESKWQRYSFGRDGDGVQLRMPTWPWARFDNAEFKRRASKKVFSTVEAWEPSMGSLVVSSATGAAKTASVVAWLHRERDRGIERVRARQPDRLPHFAFVAAHELAAARRNSKLGDEAPLIELAKNVQILVLDEVGFEPMTEVLFEVIDARYREQKPSIITTGLRPKEFAERYGVAFYRRLTQSGRIVDDWGTKS